MMEQAMDAETRKLAIVAEVAAAAGDPITTMERLGEALGALYQAAEDAGNEPKALAISEAWGAIQDHVQDLAAIAQNGIDMTVAARESLVVTVEQRDQAIQALEDKLDSIRSMDMDDPDIETLMEAMEEIVIDGINSYDADNTADSFVESLLTEAQVPVSQDTAFAFYRILTGNDDMLISDDDRLMLLDELGQFVDGFVVRWEAAEKASGGS